MTQCRLTTDELRARATAYRWNSNHFKPAGDMERKAEERNRLYSEANLTMAELFEELIYRRCAMEETE